MEKRKILISCIIIVSIIIIVCITAIVYLKNKSKSDNSDDDLASLPKNFPVETNFKVEYDAEKVKNATEFFSIETCIKDKIDENFKAKCMKMLKKDNIYSYAVKGNINKKDIYLIFRIDMNSMAYNIERLEDISNIEDINLTTDLSEIKNNEDNVIKFVRVTDEDLCRKYLYYYNDLLLNDYEEAYKLLDDEYKFARFSSNIDNFKKYIEDRKDNIENAPLSGYSAEIDGDKKRYTIKDSYDHYYILKEDSIMNFTIKLDGYTIKSDSYDKNYKSLKEAEKTSANLGIFIEMINNKDYSHAYENLSEGFKNNYFKTQEEFEKYIKNKWYDTLGYEIKNYTNEGKIYIYEINLKNLKGREVTTKEQTFNIRLNEEDDTKYEISFKVE